MFSRKAHKVSAPRVTIPVARRSTDWREFFPGGGDKFVNDTVWNDPSVSRDSARYQR